MRRHAKASTAGSTQRWAGRLGRFFRGADATRGTSSDSKGSSAPSARRLVIPLSAFAAILSALVFVVALASAAAPKATTGSASNIEKTAARLNGTVNPEGVLLEECKFQYGLTESYGQTKACNLTPAEIGTGTGDVAVNADLTGLTIGTTYHFRIVAKNSEGTVNGADQTFKTLSPPVIAAWAENVVRTEATLKAQINPEGFATTYKLEWGPTVSYGNSTAPANVGSDKANHTFSHPLTGLEPGATYHYRFIATNSIGTTEVPDHTFTTYVPVSLDTDCSNQSFRTGAAAQLPECRAYEMVSPVDKNNGDIAWLYGTIDEAALNLASLDGNKISYSSYKAFGDAISAPLTSQYVASRSAAGWSSHSINPPMRNGGITFGLVERQYISFSPDLSTGWVIPESGLALAPGAVEGYRSLYRYDSQTGEFKTASVGSTGSPFRAINFGGASTDGEHAAFNIEGKAYESSGGELHPLGILPDGTPYGGTTVVGGNNATTGASNRYGIASHAISDDGSRVFWTDAVANGTGLYVRENPAQPQSAINGSGECTEPAKACTVLIEKAGSEVLFRFANRTGTRVFYTVGAAGAPTALYEFAVDTKTTTLITNKSRGVAGASDDGSYLYFVSEENLDSGATAGARNLYLRHEGTVSFIATLSSEDTAPSQANGGPSVVAESPAHLTTRVTADGLHLAFMSDQSLTGYDNTDAATGEAVGEVYLYDVVGSRLTCVSCNPSGARPSGSTGYPKVIAAGEKFEGRPVAAWIPAWSSQTTASHPLTVDGDRLFFNSNDALVPQDTNGVQDVYEWETLGTGGCSESDPSFSEQNDGCVSLLSSGESPEDSEFVDAGSSGDDVFIRTKSSLQPQDPGLIDIYDARVGGGFPAPLESASCVGDTCQSAPEPPNDATPASASFRGAGNPVPHRARRNCRARKQQASKRGHEAKHKSAKRCKRAKRRAAR